MSAPSPRRIVVGISGASGALLAVRLLQALHALPDVETHLVISQAGSLTLQHEMQLTPADLLPLVHRQHPVGDLGAPLASGSFRCQAMVVVPCAMRTLAALAHGLGDTLLTRAADVMLKERRRLILVAREAPLNLAHLRNMTTLTEMGAIIYPPVPAFYQHPRTMEDMARHTVARLLDLLDLPQTLSPQWEGLHAAAPLPEPAPVPPPIPASLRCTPTA
jgi:4-hydroxy-3-polyprenylbenzoate decarboxylase